MTRKEKDVFRAYYRGQYEIQFRKDGVYASQRGKAGPFGWFCSTQSAQESAQILIQRNQ